MPRKGAIRCTNNEYGVRWTGHTEALEKSISIGAAGQSPLHPFIRGGITTTSSNGQRATSEVVWNSTPSKSVYSINGGVQYSTAALGAVITSLVLVREIHDLRGLQRNY